MTPPAVARLVTRLFAASGRDFGQTHLEVYAEGLAHVDDDVAEQAGRELVRVVSWDSPPSVRLVLEQVRSILARQDRERAAIPVATGNPVSPERAKAELAKIRTRRCGEPARVSIDALGGVLADGDTGLTR